MTDTEVVRIPQTKLFELIQAQLTKQADAIPGFGQTGLREASALFAEAVYAMFNAAAAKPMSDEDALCALGFAGEAFESIASNLCEAHFAEED